MKKLLIFWLAVFGFVGIFGPTTNARTPSESIISDYKIDYELSKDSENRSILDTKEKITVLFPNSDLKHGIERSIPKSFDGHPVDLNILSVKDDKGKNINYTTYSKNDNTVIRIGDADKYVRGKQVYFINYKQRDVTKYFTDNNSTEFYWDTNGLDWQVPIENLKVTAQIDESLTQSLNGKKSCYLGSYGEANKCSLKQKNNVFEVEATDLNPGQNVTIAIGFNPDTFAAYQKSFAEKVFTVWLISSFISGFFAAITILWIFFKYNKIKNDRERIGTVVPEYIPPRETSVSVAGTISQKTNKIFAAQLVDLAVRHYLKIYQTREKSFFKKANYEIEIVKDISNLLPEEKEILTDIFPLTKVGSKLDLSKLKNNQKTFSALSNNPLKIRKSIENEYGLRKKDELASKYFKKIGLFNLVLAVLFLSPIFLVAAIIAFIYMANIKPLTDKGVDLKRYLLGLEMYIKVAETDRLKMLQSPEGAVKVGESIDAKNPKQLIKLYERVLPYAILFGQEKDWNTQLSQYYQTVGHDPDWINTRSTFNAVAFSSAINSFSSSVTYSSPLSSSSSGSSGGGFSGGGGGGGGGGTW